MSYYRKVIRIQATDSPNVRRELLRQQGVPESEWPPETPGVLTWAEYQQRRATWDKIRQCIGLDADFYEGAELLLFPPEWLNRAEQLAELLRGKPRKAKAIGCDPGEGGANSAWCVVDEFGILEMLSLKTPDTTVVPSTTAMLMRKWDVPAERVILDRGGGGKQHADTLEAQGLKVRSVGFGASPTLEIKRGIHSIEARRDVQEERYVYVNLRAQMFHEASLLLDPARTDGSFAISAEYTALRHQLSVMPKLTDAEGRYWLPPKSKRDEKDTRKTLVEMIGHSPDEADAYVLAIHGMLHKSKRAQARAF